MACGPTLGFQKAIHNLQNINIDRIVYQNGFGILNTPTVHPHLTLRGLCPESHIDQAYLARNDPLTGYLFFYGTHKTIVRFDGKKWRMWTAFFNTSASTEAKPDTFVLGKQLCSR